MALELDSGERNGDCLIEHGISVGVFRSFV